MVSQYVLNGMFYFFVISYIIRHVRLTCVFVKLLTYCTYLLNLASWYKSSLKFENVASLFPVDSLVVHLYPWLSVSVAF